MTLKEEMETDRVRFVVHDVCEIEVLRFCGVETVGGSMMAARSNKREWCKGYSQSRKTARSYNSRVEELLMTRVRGRSGGGWESQISSAN